MFLKFVFSRKATKIDKIFTVDLKLCNKCQIDSEDLVKFCGLLRKRELYWKSLDLYWQSFSESLCLYVDKYVYDLTDSHILCTNKSLEIASRK